MFLLREEHLTKLFWGKQHIHVSLMCFYTKNKHNWVVVNFAEWHLYLMIRGIKWQCWMSGAHTLIVDWFLCRAVRTQRGPPTRTHCPITAGCPGRTAYSPSTRSLTPIEPGILWMLSSSSSFKVRTLDHEPSLFLLFVMFY